MSWADPAEASVSWAEPAEASMSWTEPAEASVCWTEPAEASVSWTEPAEASVSWTEPTLGGAPEVLILVGALESAPEGAGEEQAPEGAGEEQAPEGAGEEQAPEGAGEEQALDGARLARNWTEPAGKKVSWTGFRLGIGDLPDIGSPSPPNSGWKCLEAPRVDGMRSRAGTGS